MCAVGRPPRGPLTAHLPPRRRAWPARPPALLLLLLLLLPAGGPRGVPWGWSSGPRSSAVHGRGHGDLGGDRRRPGLRVEPAGGGPGRGPGGRAGRGPGGGGRAQGPAGGGAGAGAATGPGGVGRQEPLGTQQLGAGPTGQLERLPALRLQQRRPGAERHAGMDLPLLLPGLPGRADAGAGRAVRQPVPERRPGPGKAV